ncbi:uncharacterized protein LOC141619473 [Silene latifolia]|uniref:uncharacterized protein LOC141619473 n=1 Tax=Silene latifolia TaxID=37657 RepID=UPI003D777F93
MPSGLWGKSGRQNNNNNGGYNSNNGGSYQRPNNNVTQNSAAKLTASTTTVQVGDQKSSGKLFMIGKQEAEDDARVVTGTFLVHNTPSFVLFDSGATHSFVCRSHALTMGLGEYELVKDNVFIPSGESVSCSKLYRYVSILVGEVDLPVNLLEFPMDEFEVIVGMDWLGKYDAKIDCRQKRVSLKGPKGVKVSYRGFLVRPKLKFITVMTLKSCLRKKRPLILCQVRDMRVEEPSASDIPVVREFGDVILDEKPGLPPKRDIDFNVELKPGTRPISKAPYQMGPKELEELKKQLNDLLDKG